MIFNTSNFKNPYNFASISYGKAPAPQGKDGVIVIDDFNKINVDINGDLIPDLSHGEVVSRIIRAVHPNTKIRKEQTSNNSQTIAVLTKIKNAITPPDQLSGDAEPKDDYSDVKAICMPLAFFKTIEELQEKVDQGINNSNLRQFAAKVREKMPEELEEPQTLTTIKLIEDINNAPNGIQVFLPGGNCGKDNVNLLNFANGARNIGVVNAKGVKVETYGVNDLIAQGDYRKGIFNVYEVDDGFSILDDNKNPMMIGGKPIFSREELKGEVREPVTMQFIGKHIDNVTRGAVFEKEKAVKKPAVKNALNSFFDYMKKLRSETFAVVSFSEDKGLTARLFSIEKLKELAAQFKSPPFMQNPDHWGQKYGDYTNFEPKDADGKFRFRVDSSGTVRHDPSNTGQDSGKEGYSGKHITELTRGNVFEQEDYPPQGAEKIKKLIKSAA